MRRHRFVPSALVILFVCFPLLAATASSPPAEQISIGSTEQFESAILGETRALEIRLPPGHDDDAKAYPLLLVLDGGDWFSYMATLENMIAPNHLPEMVVVGLPNTDRRKDLDIMNDSLGEPGAGAQRFTRFLDEELFPHLAKKYRVSSFRILAGHSLAATFVVHTLLTSPELFQGYIATSPSLHSAERKPVLDREYRSLNPASLSGKFLFISAGGMERPELEEEVRRFAGDLDQRSDLDLDLHWKIYPTEGHVPIKGFYEGLRLLFGDWFPSRESFVDADWDALSEHYRKLSYRFGFLVEPPVDIAASVARRLDRAGDSEAAMVVLRDLVKVDPKNEWARNRLAELETNGLQGDYLGQKPPGMIPEPFSPFLAPTPDNKHSALSFSPDGRELYFSVYPNSEFPQKIMVTRRSGDGWSIPQVAEFSGTYQEGGPIFSPDGDRIYFYSRRPLPDTKTETDKPDIWFVERDTATGWSEPRHLPGPVNSKYGEAVQGFSADGGMLINRYKDRKIHLLRSRTGQNGTWSEPQLLKIIHFDEAFFTPVDMGRDDFVIFDVNKKTFGPWYNAYLYISFRNKDGSWTAPKSMGDMINRGEGRFPSFSPDREFLFFTSYRTGEAEFYWVDARMIDYLRDHDLDLVARLSEAVQTEGVGAAKILLARFQDLHAGHYAFDEKLFDDVADELIAGGSAKSAIEVLKLNQHLYPEVGGTVRRAKLAALQADGESMTDLHEGILSLPDLGEDELNSWGRFLVRSAQFDAAAMIFELDRTAHPWSPWAYAGLASVLKEKGDLQGARRQLISALGLDPGNTRLQDRLEKLDE
jgi:predicted alpha/beta superfamily hydrolase